MKKITKKKNKLLSKKGFTLIEIIMTIAIVGVGLVGLMSFFNFNLVDRREMKNELIAAGLAQEATEILRNIRDHNQLADNPWYANLYSAPPGTTSLCKAVDYTKLDTASYDCFNDAGSGHDYVCLDAVTGKYYQCAASDPAVTAFTRKISIVPSGADSVLDSGEYLQVTATVSWGEEAKEINAVDILFDNNF